MNMITDPREHLVVIGNGMAGMRTDRKSVV